jgi:hypothetical protein
MNKPTSDVLRNHYRPENGDLSIMDLKSASLAAVFETLQRGAVGFETAANAENASGRIRAAETLQSFALQRTRFERELSELTHHLGACIDHQCNPTCAQSSPLEITFSDVSQSPLEFVKRGEDETLLAYQQACGAGFSLNVLGPLEHQFSEVRITRARVISLQETFYR